MGHLVGEVGSAGAKGVEVVGLSRVEDKRGAVAGVFLKKLKSGNFFEEFWLKVVS